MDNSNQDEMQPLLQAAQQLSDENSDKYQNNIRLFSLLGRLVTFAPLLLVALVLTVAVSLATTQNPLVIAVIPLLWVLVRTINVKVKPPKGYRLNRDNAKALFVTIDSTAQKLGCKKIHQVILTEGVDAKVVQTPRLGLLGWQKNHLVLGLELLLVLSKSQGEAVIAHELAHLPGSKHKFHSRVFQQRLNFMQLNMAYQQADGLGPKLMARFLRWYAPRFYAYTLPFARINEYQADDLTQTIVSTQILAQTLINAYTAGPYIDKYYWQEFFKAADHSPKPDTLPWSSLTQFINQCRQSNKAVKSHLAIALGAKAKDFDSHPSLSDRLEAICADLTMPQTIEISAAQEWLNRHFDKLLSELDKQWYADMAESWLERFQYACQAKERLDALRTKNPLDIDIDKLTQWAELESEFGDPQKARELKKLSHQVQNQPIIAQQLFCTN